MDCPGNDPFNWRGLGVGGVITEDDFTANLQPDVGPIDYPHLHRYESTNMYDGHDDLEYESDDSDAPILNAVDEPGQANAPVIRPPDSPSGNSIASGGSDLDFLPPGNAAVSTNAGTDAYLGMGGDVNRTILVGQSREVAEGIINNQKEAHVAWLNSMKRIPQLKLEWRERKAALERNNVKYSSTLTSSFASANADERVIAIDCVANPSRDGQPPRWVKSFHAGSPEAIFNGLSEMDVITSVSFEEVMPAGIPLPVILDIEIKTYDCGLPGEFERGHLGLGVDDIIKLHYQHLFHNQPLTEDEMGVVGDIGAAFVRYSPEAWDEDVCAAGLRVAKEAIAVTLERILPRNISGDDGYDQYKPDSSCLANDMRVLTGCRASKFSLHVMMDNVYCADLTSDMAQVAYEISREFTWNNSTWIINNQEHWDTPEGKFRIRALMVNDMLNIRAMKSARQGDAPPPPIFLGINDTMVDEGIYVDRHLMRGIYGRKANSQVRYQSYTDNTSASSN